MHDISALCIIHKVLIYLCFVSPFTGQDVFLDYCQKLLEKFRYPWELMPLMYVILKDAGADIDEASRRIEEGKPT